MSDYYTHLPQGIKFGWGKYGSNRWHYNPSPEEISRITKKIREEGFNDSRKEWHPPWDERTEQDRRVGRCRMVPLADLNPMPLYDGQITSRFSDDAPLA